MDPQQPLPELEESDWQRFRRNFGAFWDRYGTATLVVVLLITGFIAGRRILAHRAESAHETAWRDLATITSPEVARTVAGNHKNPIRAMLYLRGADMIMSELARPDDPAGTAEAVERPEGLGALATPMLSPRADRQRSLDTARQMYEAVAEDTSAHELLRLNARLGLGAVAEARGDWDGARAVYDQVVLAGGDKYVAVATQARHRKQWLGRMAEPVRFAPESRPTIEVPGMPDLPGSLLDLPSAPVETPDASDDLPEGLLPAPPATTQPPPLPEPGRADPETRDQEHDAPDALDEE